MSWLLFMDESGHDHKNMPMEVRGGVAVHTSKIWPFIKEWEARRDHVFGKKFQELGGEIKGSKLLETRKFTWAGSNLPRDDETRRRRVYRFLTKSAQKEKLKANEFSAYGHACILMAESIFELLENHGAVLFASAIPRGAKPPEGFQFGHYLRKDHVFLQERFYYFLEAKQEHGLFIMDQSEKQQDRRFVKRLYSYYTKTQTGRSRSHWIIPSPLFVDSELSVGVQAADLCLYCINWGFRPPYWQFRGNRRKEIAEKFGWRLSRLQFKGDGIREGSTFRTQGIVYVDDPFTSRDK